MGLASWLFRCRRPATTMTMWLGTTITRLWSQVKPGLPTYQPPLRRGATGGFGPRCRETPAHASSVAGDDMADRQGWAITLVLLLIGLPALAEERAMVTVDGEPVGAGLGCARCW